MDITILSTSPSHSGPVATSSASTPSFPLTLHPPPSDLSLTFTPSGLPSSPQRPTHRMITRLQNNIRKPINRLNLMAQLNSQEVEPKTVTQALKDPHGVMLWTLNLMLCLRIKLGI